MSLVKFALLLTMASVALARSQESELSMRGLEIPAPVKIDKNLRRALLKALADLEAESAEQHKEENAAMAARLVGAKLEDIAKKDLNKNLGIVQKPTYSFNGFPGDEEIPSEDKLQNSSFVQAHFVPTKLPSMSIEKASRNDARSFHVQNVIMPTKNTPVYGSKSNEVKVDQGRKSPKQSASSTTVTKVESISLQSANQFSESLAGSASSSIAVANSLTSPKPTVASPTVAPSGNTTALKLSKEKSEEVKIFQAPLVAAFTVQQDEQGIPKSVVPIYRSANDGSALTLQEQLDFKQRLLEKQLADLQQQQLQQTQFLIRQRQLYEQQFRQKQQQQFYIQEQSRIKQLEEQARIKQLEDQQRFKQLDEQRLFRFQQHNFPQKQRFFEQNNVLPIQPSIDTNVHLQPSVSLEIPNVALPPPFQPNYQDHLRLQQQRQPQHPQPPQQQQQPPHQQRLQNFNGFPTTSEFQSPHTSTTRFNRQEAFNSVGNFGFNFENKPITSRNNNFAFTAQPQRPTSNFAFNPYAQYNRQQTPRPPTPAKQIQHLLYQSGIAGEIGGAEGTSGQEDLNILSKVLALNVGAIPAKNGQFTGATSNHGNTLLGQA